MQIGRIIITTKKKFTKVINKEIENAKVMFMENEFPKMHDEIWETAINEYQKTPTGKVVMERKELEEENERLKKVEEEFNNILWAKRIMDKFNKRW